MTRDRAEVIRRTLDAYNRGNYDAASEYLHPDVVLVHQRSRITGAHEADEARQAAGLAG